jgi:hypothetical protein
MLRSDERAYSDDAELHVQLDQLLYGFVEQVIRRKGRMLPFGLIRGRAPLFCVAGTALAI